MIPENQNDNLHVLYADNDIFVCIKPARVLSTDEPGGLPELVRKALGNEKADVRTVHRLDRVVSGVMVLARNAKAASELSRQIREDIFEKEYLAVVHGCPKKNSGTLTDLLYRDKARKMTMVASEPAKGVQEAVLDYSVLGCNESMSRVYPKFCVNSNKWRKIGRNNIFRVVALTPPLGYSINRKLHACQGQRLPGRCLFYP